MWAVLSCKQTIYAKRLSMKFNFLKKLTLFQLCAVFTLVALTIAYFSGVTSRLPDLKVLGVHVGGFAALLLLGVCQTPFDVMRAKVEDLGEHLYTRASWKDPWLNVIPRDVYPQGAGYVRSAFTIGRSEPASDEEAWQEIQPLNEAANGACSLTYNQTYVGFKENTYKPEMFGLVGPLVCQDDLVMNWNSNDFWEKYFQALEKRNTKSIVNRLGNIYMNYVPKAAANSDFHYVAGDIDTQPPGQTVDLSGIDIPQCGLIQDYLDETSLILSEEGANDPDTNGWITMGDSGPIWPLLIGQKASNQLLLNNAELREDYRHSHEGFGDANPVIARMGASRVIKNFRHMITLFPPRWRLVGGALSRVPTWLMSTASADATKGRVAKINPDWQNPNIAAWEAAIVLNPFVFREELLRPVQSTPGMKWNAQNYMGEWDFVTGNDALLGFDDCTGVQDPKHKLGRHFAEYRHAAKPIFPEYGRMIVFRRCPQDFDCVSCS